MTAPARPAVPVAEATPGRAAEIAAEQAYSDQVLLALDAPETPEVAPTDTTPKPTAKVDQTVEAADEESGDEPAGGDDETDGEVAADATDQDPDETDEDDAQDFPTVKAEDTDETFEDALEKQGVTVKLDDIKDPVARKFIETKMRDLEKGFTRAMQEARAYRKDEIQFRAEQRFQKDHRDDFIVSMLLEDPDLGERVNAKLDEMASPTARKAQEVVVRDARAQARTAEEQRIAEDQKWRERGLAVERYATRQAEKAGLPYSLGVGDAVYAVVVSRTLRDKDGNVTQQGDITRAEVDQIIREKAEQYQRSIRAHKREDRKKYIADKAADAKNAGLKVKPGAGAAPGIGKKPVPQNDDEFAAAVLAQL